MRVINSKKVLIIGKGISGLGAARALRETGTDCVLCDEEDFDKVFSPEFDLIVVSPSVAKTHRVFPLAEAAGTEVISEIELGYRLCDKPVIAVTGTNGKTTVVKLMGDIFSRSRKTCVTGNVGSSFAADATENYDLFVTEVSSFQLENVRLFAPDIAVVTNITPDHLDRHNSFEEYARTKLKIAQSMGKDGWLVLSANDIPAKTLAGFSPQCNVVYTCVGGRVNGAYSLSDKFYWFDEFICQRNQMAMRGVHNEANALSAIAAAKIAGVENKDIIATLSEFHPDEHRVQYVDSIMGAAFYDDSKGTNIDACVKAMQTMPSSFCLIAGGSDKGYEFDDIFLKAPSNLKKVCALGETADKIVCAAKRNGFIKVIKCLTLTEAVIEAYHSDVDAVLLSPAAASFDMFENYAARGSAFIEIVKELKKIETRR